MSRQRMVERFQSVAVADSAAFYPYFAGYSCALQIRSARAWDFNLSARSDLSNFHLDQKDSTHLAGLHLGDARRHRITDGIVPLRAHHDCHESGGIRHKREESEAAACYFGVNVPLPSS